MNFTEEYRTDDMALVTYLRVNGVSPRDVYYEHPNCYWLYNLSDEIAVLVGQFETGQATVQPKEYSKNFKVTRAELNDARDGSRSGNRR